LGNEKKGLSLRDKKNTKNGRRKRRRKKRKREVFQKKKRLLSCYSSLEKKEITRACEATKMGEQKASEI